MSFSCLLFKEANVISVILFLYILTIFVIWKANRTIIVAPIKETSFVNSEMIVTLFLNKVYIIQVGSRNNFRLAGWNLGIPCI